MEMEDQYTMGDLRHLMNSHSHFSAPTTAAGLFSPHRANLTHPPPQYANLLMIPPRGPYELPQYTTDYTTAAGGGVSATCSGGGVDTDLGSFGGDGGTGRWPRQETLTLLEIRSRLDSKFKETNQKGPLWDDVSRIMCEEHGYQRSGKKCREKFENLYKYYKKTKEGKAGRQDGKHYRFFRQLEALYGHTTATQKQVVDGASATAASQAGGGSFSFSTSSEVDTSSSEEEDESGTGKQLPRKRKWKAKVREFVDAQMRRLTEKQEAWLENMVRTIEQKEQERIHREQEWRAQEASRLEREHRYWANERTWIKARDAALLEALQKITGRRDNNSPMQEDMMPAPQSEIPTDGDTIDRRRWCESEIARLVQPRGTENTNEYDLTRSICCFPQMNANAARPEPPQSPPSNSNGGGNSNMWEFPHDGGNSNMWEGYGMKENR